MFDISLKAAAIGTIMSTVTAGVNYSIDFAQSSSLGYNSLNLSGGIAPITPAFGEMLKGFFGTVDDATASIMCE